MKLTLKTDYALRVLIFLQTNERATIKEIADYFAIKKNHLSVVVNKLSDLDYINSSPGPKGGISINPLALKRNLKEIVMAFEEFELVECFNEEKDLCRLSPTCRLKTVLKRANAAFLKELEGSTLGDL